MELKEQFNKKELPVPNLSEYASFDPDYDKFVGKSVKAIEQKIKNNQIVLKTHILPERFNKILEEGLKNPIKYSNEKRRDSGGSEEKAIFATTRRWNDSISEGKFSVVNFLVSIDKVYVRSTYRGRDGRRFMVSLDYFLNYNKNYGRPPFDSHQIEYLIYEDIPPDNFMTNKEVFRYLKKN